MLKAIFSLLYPSRSNIIIVFVIVMTAWLLRLVHLALPSFDVPTHAGVRGSYHVHSQSSHDSFVPAHAYAEAAAEAGLDFVVLTDHDVQTWPPWVDTNVLMIPQAELSRPCGHVVALGAHQVLNNHAVGGAGAVDPLKAWADADTSPIIAHPTSVKRPWTGRFDHARGMEVASFSSAFENEAGPYFVGVTGMLWTWLFRHDVALWQLYGRDGRAMYLWDHMLWQKAVGMCAVDAHGWLDLKTNLLAWTLTLERLKRPKAWSQEHADEVLQALRAGHFYCTAGLLAKNGITLDFFVETALGTRIRAGDTIEQQGQNKLVASMPAAKNTRFGALTLHVYHDGDEVLHSAHDTIEIQGPTKGLWRGEIHLQVPSMSWGNTTRLLAFSNRIVVR